MTYRIIVEPTAEREIRSAVRWKTANASLTVADRWYNGLIKKIETLHRLPIRCPSACVHGVAIEKGNIAPWIPSIGWSIRTRQ